MPLNPVGILPDEQKQKKGLGKKIGQGLGLLQAIGSVVAAPFTGGTSLATIAGGVGKGISTAGTAGSIGGAIDSVVEKDKKPANIQPTPLSRRAESVAAKTPPLTIEETHNAYSEAIQKARQLNDENLRKQVSAPLVAGFMANLDSARKRGIDLA